MFYLEEMSSEYILQLSKFETLLQGNWKWIEQRRRMRFGNPSNLHVERA